MRSGAQLGQTLAERVGVQRILIDLTRHLEFHLDFGSQRDPARHHPHHALFGIAVIGNVDSAWRTL